MSAWRFPKRAFSLVEVLVATSVLFILVMVVLQLTGNVADIWRTGSGKIAAFQNARSAFSTINRTISRATLNTYDDYVQEASPGVFEYRTAANAANFSPAKFLRASELHFLSGPASQIVPGADAVKNPGHAIFFQVPMGQTDDVQYKGLNRTLNSTGFYIEYGSQDESMYPDWLKPFLGGTKRFRLVQLVEPAEKLKIYTSTGGSAYDLAWLQSFATLQASPQLRARVLAEDVPLLVIRPRPAPEDEKTVAQQLGQTYNAGQPGSILCPNYHYDSRAWQNGYPASQRVRAAPSPAARAELMRNQIPPIVDITMLCVDRRSLGRFDFSGALPPAPLQMPAGFFTDSTKFDADLAAYGKQLSDAGIRYRVFRSSVGIQGAKWSNQ